MNGVLNIFKPKGMSSHDVVSFLRRKLRMKRIGHTGTLDPEVSGVLPICIGQGTRIAEYLLDSDKSYIGEVSLGISTDTLDGTGRVVEFKEVTPVDLKQVKEILHDYTGEVDQKPPMYSAIKYKGKRLYEYAREGINIEVPSRKIYIYENNLLKMNGDKILFRSHCSKGTYIRVLAYDIAKATGNPGYMSYLIRDSSGPFTIDKSYSLEYIGSLDLSEIRELLVSMEDSLSFMGKLIFPKEDYDRIRNGVKIDANRLNKELGAIGTRSLVYAGEEFMGVGSIQTKGSSSFLKMDKVLV